MHLNYLTTIYTPKVDISIWYRQTISDYFVWGMVGGGGVGGDGVAMNGSCLKNY